MLKVVQHPLIDVKLSIMRDENTKSKEFRENLNEIASFMCFEVFKDLKTYIEEPNNWDDIDEEQERIE